MNNTLPTAFNQALFDFSILPPSHSSYFQCTSSHIANSIIIGNELNKMDLLDGWLQWSMRFVDDWMVPVAVADGRWALNP